MRTGWALFPALVLAALLALAAPSRALAHGGHIPSAVQTFTQAVGPYELAVTFEIPPSTPAPLYLKITPQSDLAGTTMTFRAAPRGQPFDGAPSAQVLGMPGQQGSYFSEITVDRAGDWDMEVRVAGPKGSGVARLPFTIVAQSLPPSSLGLFITLGGLIVLMIANIVLGASYQRRGRQAPAWARWLIGQSMFACLILAGVFGFQQFSAAIQAANAQAAGMQVATTTTPAGRPHANIAARTDPGAPVAGQPLTLTLDLSDGSTGLPVEDLVTHHEALIHLIVASADGGDFKHIHPPRVAPGRYAIALTPDRPGRYTAYAELQRQDSGTQVIARSFEVGGAASNPPPPTTEGLGAREVAGMQVNVSSSVSSFKAGKQATFTFSFSQNGKPVADLQPYLGMAGHLIALSADRAIFGHIHAQGPMAPSGLVESAVSYGPDIRFVYTFPQPGRYQMWGQVRRGGQIVTVPLVVEVQ